MWEMAYVLKKRLKYVLKWLEMRNGLNMWEMT